MTEALRPAKHVEVFQPRQLRLVRTQPPSLSPDQRIAMDRAWQDAVRANPHLYDGPAVVCTRLDHSAEELVLTWAPMPYRYFTLRRAGAECAPGLFTAVIQPVDTGGLVVGRTSTATAIPGRVHLPGGVVEPPIGPDIELDPSDLAYEAARELAEETGLVTPSEHLTLCLVTQADRGNVGVIFRAPVIQEPVLRAGFAAHHARETAAGRPPEFDAVHTVATTHDLATLGGPYADSAIPVLRHYEAMTGRIPPAGPAPEQP